MKALTSLALAFLALAFFAAALPLSTGAQAQPAAKFFFEGDLVRGDQEGAPGPFCVLNNQFKRLEKVVWRMRVLDPAGKALDDKGMKSLVVELPDGQKLAARFSGHPPPRVGPAVDHFWTARWIIPTDYPSGSFAYKLTATGLDGGTQTWEPFKTGSTQLTVVPGQIEIKKP